MTTELTAEQLRIVDLEQALLLERERLEKTKEERDVATASFADLLSVLRDTGKHVCVYCGHTGSMEGIRAHLEVCEKHPMAKLRAAIANEGARAGALVDSIRAMQEALETDKTSALAVALRATCTAVLKEAGEPAVAPGAPEDLLGALRSRYRMTESDERAIRAHLRCAYDEGLGAREPSLEAVYDERNRVVAALAHVALRLGWRAGLRAHEPDPDPSWSDDWRNVVLVDLPTGQVSWHYHDSARPLFKGLAAYAGAWDGHTTAVKYQRCAALAAPRCELPSCDRPSILGGLCESHAHEYGSDTASLPAGFGQVKHEWDPERMRCSVCKFAYHISIDGDACPGPSPTAPPTTRSTNAEANAGRAGHVEELVHVPPADAGGAADVHRDPGDGPELRNPAHGEVPAVGGPDRGAPEAPGVRGHGEHVDRVPRKVDLPAWFGPALGEAIVIDRINALAKKAGVILTDETDETELRRYFDLAVEQLKAEGKLVAKETPHA